MTSNLQKIANAFNQECFEPKLSHYPSWFRQFIDDPLQGCSYGLVGMLRQPMMRDHVALAISNFMNVPPQVGAFEKKAGI
jgi:hypothetical protein